ncbi:MAG: hypothetical protein J0I20_01255 [Chloroflexi bacterium]|jgi:hypothetical protein|nr:hypothetical protein [Chloroflexota bacterium]OJV89583.1 MAG: hypothetical protein BGO39_37125 [Chloroflexi bacterium 54-19]
MEDFINQMVAKVGIDKETAEKVVNFLKEHASELPKIIGENEFAKGIVDKLPGGLGGMFGGNKD